LRRAASAIHRALDAPSDPTVFGSGQTPLGDVQGSHNDRKHIIEVVRDTARQLPNGFDFLHLTNLRFRSFSRQGLMLQLPVC